MITRLENMFNGCPELTKEEMMILYPMPSEEDINMISTTVINAPYILEPVCRINTNILGEDYLEIIFYNTYIFPESHYERFVIAKGYKMEDSVEKRFFHILNDYKISIRMDVFKDIQDEVKNFCPESHIVFYNETWRFRLFIEQVYYSTHNSGVREILYKCPGIENVVYNLDKFDYYNMIGATAEEILGLPLKLLRYLNNSKMMDLVFKEADREKLREIYSEFAGYINSKNKPNYYQFMYFLEYKTFGKVRNGKFSKMIYDGLASVNSTEFYKLYALYVECSAELGENNPYKVLPKDMTIYDVVVEQRQFLRLCFENREKTCAKLLASDANKYEMDSEEYAVISPKKPEEIFNEARYQQNCLLNYFDDIMSKNTNILFVRRKEDMSKPYVTMEIKNGKIVQVYGRFNKLPTIETIFFIGQYAEKFNLKFHGDELIDKVLERLNSDGERYKSALEYMEELNIKRNWRFNELTEEEKEQISMWDFDSGLDAA